MLTENVCVRVRTTCAQCSITHIYTWYTRRIAFIIIIIYYGVITSFYVDRVRYKHIYAYIIYYMCTCTIYLYVFALCIVVSSSSSSSKEKEIRYKKKYKNSARKKN